MIADNYTKEHVLKIISLSINQQLTEELEKIICDNLLQNQNIITVEDYIKRKHYLYDNKINIKPFKLVLDMDGSLDLYIDK